MTTQRLEQGMAGGSSNTLRAVLKELGWSRTRLVAELRRQAASSGESLPGPLRAK